MKKLFLIALFTVSGAAFAHCGTCGVGDSTKKCDKADGQCSSDAHHDSAHAENDGEEKTQSEAEESSEQ